MRSVAARRAAFLGQDDGGIVCAFDDVGAVAFYSGGSLAALRAFYSLIMLFNYRN